MTTYKTVCVASLGAVFALAAGFFVVTEVNARGLSDDLPLPVVVDQATIEQASAFAGEYEFAGGQKERDALDAAIETAMDAVSPMVRGIGRKRLHETNPIPNQVEVAVAGEAVEIMFGSHGHNAALDGKPIKGLSPQGDKIKVSHRLSAGKLRELLDGDKGDRRNTLELSADGQRLTIHVEITSGHLPVPVEYRLTYKRK